MKKIILSLLSYAFVLNTYAGENAIKIKSDIKEATVFLYGAQVTNVGSTSIGAGTSELVFNNLSSNINIASIQAKGEGDFTILSVVHKLNYLNQQPKSKEIIALEDSMETLQNKLELQAGLRNVYENEESMLLANKSIGGDNNGVSSIELEKIANILRSRLIDLKSKRLEITIKEKKLNESLTKINYQLSELNNKRNRATSEITITVAAKGPTTAKLSVIYQITNAGWSPSYDIRATDSSSPIKLTYKANVFQNSGFDWNNVKITLSTGNPGLSGSKPILNPWSLSYYSPGKYRKRSVSNGKSADYGFSAAPSAMYDSMEIEEKLSEAGSSSKYVEVAETQTNTEYEIGIPYDVPSDGKSYIVEIQNYSIPASYQYYCAPKIDKDAFLLAKITGWDQYNLLSGTSNIYFEGTYVGQSYLNTISTNDTLDISLGRDKNVVVTRTKLKDFSEKKIIGLNKKETSTYEISIRNKKKQEIEIEINDQIPLSSISDIVIESLETGGADYNKETGKLVWKMKIATAETKKLKLGYTVKYPKDKVLNNL